LWRLAEVVDVPVDQPRSIGQQRTQVHDRLGEMALGHRHVVALLGVPTTTHRCTLLGSSCFGKNAKGPGGEVAHSCENFAARPSPRPPTSSKEMRVEICEQARAAGHRQWPEGEGK
jgi:hypothetical protein